MPSVSEVCIPLAHSVLAHTIVVLGGLVVLRDHTNRVYGVATTGVLDGAWPAAF
jgi:hydrogenase/urease accessory protein HupE